MAQLSPELIVGGIVGFLLFWQFTGQVLKGLREASKSVKSVEPITTAVSISWDRDQIERAVQALETIGKAQTAMLDKRTASMEEKLDDLLEHETRIAKALEKLSDIEARPRPRR